MKQSVLDKLEYPAILDRLARRCDFALASERARELKPSSDPDQVGYLLSVTGEAVALMTIYPEFSVGGARDIRVQVDRASHGSRLAPTELLLVQDTATATRNLRQTFARIVDADTRFPRLLEFVGHLADLYDLDQAIGRTIGPRGDILDTASPDLARIRREVRVSHSRLMERLNNLISGGRYASAVQDQIITMRDGRYVIPIRSESRGAVPGMVHDTSASGQTLFVEPFDVVDLNNRWREQQAAEQHEIDRILDALTHMVAERAADLRETMDAIAALDLALAKSRLASDQEANRPAVAPRPVGPKRTTGAHSSLRVRLRNARHPLLDPKTVVPLNLHIGQDFRVLVITGPNTGGKTVALKTVGLLALMAQTGLFIPAGPESELSVFSSIFVDIGDEQSIQQSLSTFSAHMRSVIDMLGQVRPESLVLLDEMGAGTDPQEGSALARSLLQELLDRGAMVIATTHFSEVKAFAYATPGLENASVEFDVETLSPTYRLTIGVPGESNALAIANRLGLSRRVLERAATMVNPDDERTDALLRDIRVRREETEQSLARAEATEQEARQLRTIAARSLRSAEEERRTAREEALAEAQGELQEIRETLRSLQSDRSAVGVTRDHIEQRRRDADRATDVAKRFRRERIEINRPIPLGLPNQRPIRAGDRVIVTSLGAEGEVTAVSDGQADIQMGSLKMRQPVEALERLGRSATSDAERRVTRPVFNENVPIELDLRGQRASEVPEMLESYLESAARSNLPFVHIIHGKGTGALREVVRTHLHRHPAIESAALARPEQGGDGVTVAYLRGA